MGIMDTFRNAVGLPSAVPANMTPQGQPGATPGQPGNLPATQPAMTANPSGVPGAQATPTEPEKSPFADFDKLWDIPKLPEGQIPDEPIRFNVDGSKVAASAKQIDFTKAVTPALLEKINAGGEGALQAMMQAMNEMGQTIFAQSMIAGTKVTENALEMGHQRVQRTLPTTIRKANIRDQLREDNPLFTNPATAPLLGILEQQLTTQFPTATPAEISAHARKYISTFANEATKLTPEYQQQQQRVREADYDWSNEPT